MMDEIDVIVFSGGLVCGVVIGFIEFDEVINGLYLG